MSSDSQPPPDPDKYLAFDDRAVISLLNQFEKSSKPKGEPIVKGFVQFLTTANRSNLEDDQSNKDRASSIFSEKSNPLNLLDPSPQTCLGGGSFEISRHYLVAWLWIMDLLCCPVTGRQPVATTVVQFSHMLIPQSERHNNSMIRLCEYVLGMNEGSLRIDSRLFIMPLAATVHRLHEGRLLLFLPTAEMLDVMSDYLRGDVTDERNSKLRRVLRRPTEKLSAQQVESMTIKGEGKNDGDRGSPWLRLRSEVGSPFRAGTVHQFHLVNHPELQLPLQQQRIRSHISPFAAALDAFITLGEWQECRVIPEIPKPSSQSGQSVAVGPATLERGLLSSGFDATEAWKLSIAFEEFCAEVKVLEGAFRRRGWPSDTSHDSRNKSNRDGGGSSRRSCRGSNPDSEGKSGGGGGGGKRGAGNDLFDGGFAFPTIQTFYETAAPHQFPPLYSSRSQSSCFYASTQLSEKTNSLSFHDAFLSSDESSGEEVLVPELQTDRCPAAGVGPSDAELIANEYRDRSGSVSVVSDSRSSPTIQVSALPTCRVAQAECNSSPLRSKEMGSINQISHVARKKVESGKAKAREAMEDQCAAEKKKHPGLARWRSLLSRLR